MSLEGFLATLTIDALEERHVAIADVAGAFLKADMNDFVVVKIQGPAVDALLSNYQSKYKKYVIQTNNKQTIYVRLRKAMYGTLKAPL